MAEALRAGLVGLGSLSQRGILPHFSLPDAREKVHLVAVADVVGERAREIAERFDVPHHFTSTEEMLAGTDLDMVLVATPVQYHFANAIAAIEAGKHVYVQKAMTATLDEAERLLTARDRKGVKLNAAPGYEICTTTGQMRRLVQAGALGRIFVAYTYTLGFGGGRQPKPGVRDPLAEIDPTWLYQKGGGGPLPWVTVYSLQLATSVLGPVRRVTALANTLTTERVWADKRIPVEIEDNNLLLMEFASGALGTAVGSRGRGGECTFWGAISLHGDAGALEITDFHNPSGYPLGFAIRGGVAERFAAAGLAGPAYQAGLADQPYLVGEHLEIDEPHVYADIMDLAEAVLDNRPVRAPGEQGRHVVEIIEKSLVAARTGRAQELTTTFEPPVT